MSVKIPQTCPKFSLFLFFLLLLQFAQGQTDFSRVDQLLEKNKKLLGNNVVALVWKDGKVIYQKEIGTDFTAKTQAPIASCSKWLTAATIMTLVDEGKISLDDQVSKYIPVLDKYMKGYITIRQCLSHTTGIDGKGGLASLLQRKKFESLADEANAIAAKEISNNPGKEFAYGSSGLNLAARVAEIVSKKDFSRLVQEKITRPLKMRATTFVNDNGNAPNPSGGAQSSALDYMNFLIMILNKGVFEGKRILSEESIGEMQKNHFPGLPVKFTPKVAEGFEYGLGEWIQEKDANGNSTVVSSPGLFGTWPYVDKCRGYAAIIFVKTILGEQKKDFYLQFKEAVDEQVGPCK
ncbi:class A beta-lactamase-related serine hydrolase [Paraflavitalea soli]|uniref:Class A beta-lactamase-related serine hydrolase n=1 Tax=Paraflavitalea soli TaxID=2315862 RepID=A0A3B7MM93_9BACT|nr:serine hydrolase domain-containing protein [Paraflavitalea soli]AXY75248.1 class A beta-lactamase-related serine hydrolase [Paraflavitalea soli]